MFVFVFWSTICKVKPILNFKALSLQKGSYISLESLLICVLVNIYIHAQYYTMIYGAGAIIKEKMSQKHTHSTKHAVLLQVVPVQTLLN